MLAPSSKARARPATAGSRMTPLNRSRLLVKRSSPGQKPDENARRTNLPLSQHTARASTPDAIADANESAKATPAVYKAVVIACLGAFLFGYHLGVVNGPLGQIAADLNFGDNVSLQGLVVSISLAGAAIGSLSGTVLADALGRVRAFAADALPLLAGAALCATAESSTGILAGRFLVGVGIGLASALVPLYISEVAPTQARGTLGSVNQLMICIGILAALVANVVLPVADWRTMFWLSAVPAGLLGAGILTSPESPSFLLSKGDRAGAESAAQALWGRAYHGELYGTAGAPADVAKVAWERDLEEAGDVAKDRMQQAQSGDLSANTREVGKMTMTESKSDGVSMGEMFSGTKGKLVLIACSLFIFQQFSGINAIVYFSSKVFRDAGVGSETLASAAVGVVNVVGTVIAASLMDKAGRKQLLTISLAGQGICMAVMAAAFVTPALQGASGTIALAFTILYVLAFALGTGPVPGLLAAELLPTSIRGRGVSFAMVIHWICNFGIGQMFLPLAAAVGVAQVYGGFAVVCALGVFFVSTQLVETKGRSPAEIERLMK